jgi:hypothetical protein
MPSIFSMMLAFPVPSSTLSRRCLIRSGCARKGGHDGDAVSVRVTTHRRSWLRGAAARAARARSASSRPCGPARATRPRSAGPQRRRRGPSRSPHRDGLVEKVALARRGGGGLGGGLPHAGDDARRHAHGDVADEVERVEHALGRHLGRCARARDKRDEDIYARRSIFLSLFPLSCSARAAFPPPPLPPRPLGGPGHVPDPPSVRPTSARGPWRTSTWPRRRSRPPSRTRASAPSPRPPTSTSSSAARRASRSSGSLPRASCPSSTRPSTGASRRCAPFAWRCVEERKRARAFAREPPYARCSARPPSVPPPIPSAAE